MIKIGPAGTSGLGYIDGLNKCEELGLEALEVEFTYGVRMTNAEAKEIGKLAEKLNISLSIHAPYYINLASLEKVKVNASKKRILQSCERGHYLNAKYIVFHAGFYGKKAEKEIFDMSEIAKSISEHAQKPLVFEIIKKEILDLEKTIKQKAWNVTLSPETTGKVSQFGSLDELLALKKETSCHPCIDFAHLKARNNGKIDYDALFNKIKKLGHIHSHFSGIEYGPKGERKHLITQRNDLMPLIRAILKHKIDITIINESPDPFGDCIKTKKIIKELK